MVASWNALPQGPAGALPDAAGIPGSAAYRPTTKFASDQYGARASRGQCPRPASLEPSSLPEQVPRGRKKTRRRANLLVGASRPWRDLVAVHDYFYPVSDLHLIDRERYLGSNRGHVQVGEFLPAINLRLRPLGDFVSRTRLDRIDY